MEPARGLSWASPWVRRSVLWLGALAAACILVGFVVLPAVQADYTAQGLWARICRAAGAPARWSTSAPETEPGSLSTLVVLSRTMTEPASADAIGRGATLALGCTMCHGARGSSTSNAPNLAGQYPEVVQKQLADFRNHRRSSTIMEALAANLSDRDIRDLSAYYASLPKARVAPTTYDEALPALVRVGDPLRNIAPCIACHGQVDQKLGAPWIEGMPKAYLVAELEAFRGGQRHNDAEQQMRNMARSMTDPEIDAVSAFYAGKAGTPLPSQQ